MFAACLELDTANPIGNQLVNQAQQSGLASIPYDELALWQQPGVTLVQQRQLGGSEEKNKLQDEASITQDSENLILFWGRIDNVDELYSELGLETTQKISDAELVLASWLKWGKELCQHLIGDFAILIYAHQQEFFLVRDHLGVKPLYFYKDDDRLIVATSIAAIVSLKEVDKSFSDEWILRYLNDDSPDWTKTAYTYIQKVPPAHYCQVRLRKEIEQKAYFDFSDITPLNLSSEKEYQQRYLALFKQAVSDRLESARSMASECSGGLDSTSITVLAAELMSDPKSHLHTYAMTLCEEEPEAVALANSRFEKASEFVMVQQDLAQADFQAFDEAHLESLGYPVEQGFSRLHVPFYSSAKGKGCKVLLSGFGGDEFSTIYAATARYEFWDQKRYGLWASRFRGGWLGSKLRMLKWLLRLAVYGPCTETAQKLVANIRESWSSKLLRKDVSNFAVLEKQAVERNQYDMGCKTLNEFVLNDRLSPHIPARLEACTLMAARYGIEYRWPLLDIRLIKFFLSVPSELKLGPGGIGRYLHRLSMTDLLPEALCWRDKSMGAPLPVEDEKNKEIKEEKYNINNYLYNFINLDYYNKLIQKNSSPATDSELNQLGRINQLSDWLEYSRVQ